MTRPYPDATTTWSAFTRTAGRIPNVDFVGSRDQSQEGAPYVWKTWTQVETIVNELAAGFIKLDLMPESFEEGQNWRLMGIYSKNREEWAFTALATQRQSGTVVAFYDTLGPSGVEFIIR